MSTKITVTLTETEARALCEAVGCINAGDLDVWSGTSRRERQENAKAADRAQAKLNAALRDAK